jgi:NADPH:quinone reductase-like Zn-dependent oxidoreductase
MFAVYASEPNSANPLAGLVTGDQPAPRVPDGWIAVSVRAASLNMHDVSTLRGRGVSRERFPVILGCDGAGVLEDGSEIVIHPCINDPAWIGEETLDPGRSVLSERYQGSFADIVAVPARNVLPKPASLSFEEAACIGTAWLTAYRMLFVNSGLRPGGAMLVQGRGRLGSIATALVRLGAATGMRVWVTGGEDRDTARRLGAVDTVDSRTGPPDPVDAVFDAGVDEASWSHLLRWLRPGGIAVCSGYRSGETREGYDLTALDQIIAGELRVTGSAMGTRDNLADLLSFLDRTGIRPEIALSLPLARAEHGFRAMTGRDVGGKIVFTHR